MFIVYAAFPHGAIKVPVFALNCPNTKDQVAASIASVLIRACNPSHAQYHDVDASLVYKDTQALLREVVIPQLSCLYL